jgi:hypothetical protein
VYMYLDADEDDDTLMAFTAVLKEDMDVFENISAVNKQQSPSIYAYSEGDLMHIETLLSPIHLTCKRMYVVCWRVLLNCGITG